MLIVVDFLAALRGRGKRATGRRRERTRRGGTASDQSTNVSLTIDNVVETSRTSPEIVMSRPTTTNASVPIRIRMVERKTPEKSPPRCYRLNEVTHRLVDSTYLNSGTSSTANVERWQ